MSCLDDFFACEICRGFNRASSLPVNGNFKTKVTSQFALVSRRHRDRWSVRAIVLGSSTSYLVRYTVERHLHAYSGINEIIVSRKMERKEEEKECFVKNISFHSLAHVRGSFHITRNSSIFSHT